MDYDTMHELAESRGQPCEHDDFITLGATEVSLVWGLALSACFSFLVVATLVTALN